MSCFYYYPFIFLDVIKNQFVVDMRKWDNSEHSDSLKKEIGNKIHGALHF